MAVRTVAIDSNVLVFAAQRGGSDEQRKRAGWLMEALAADKATVVFPAVCVAEYLVRVDEAQRPDVLAEVMST